MNHECKIIILKYITISVGKQNKKKIDIKIKLIILT